MESFAFIVNPIAIKQLKSFWSIWRIKNFPPFKVLDIRKIRSTQGKEISGYLIAPALLPHDMPKLQEDLILDRVIAAGQLAQKLGARILGLDGYAACIADRDYQTITKRIKIPVTTGNALTAWTIFEAIYRITKFRKINLKNTVLTIINATDSIGNLCTRKLSGYVSRIILNAQNRTKLEHLKEIITSYNPIDVEIDMDINSAVKEADIVINPSPSLDKLFDTETLKENSIFCDSSFSQDFLAKIKFKQGVTVIKNGLIKTPHPLKLNRAAGLPQGIILAPLAETILLTLEGKFVDYSLGENVNLDKLEEIADIAVQHGFEVWVPQAPIS